MVVSEFGILPRWVSAGTKVGRGGKWPMEREREYGLV